MRWGLIAVVTTWLSACSRSEPTIAPVSIDDLEITYSTFSDVSEGAFSNPPVGCDPSPCTETLSDVNGNIVSFAAGVDPDSSTRFIAMAGRSFDPTNLQPIQQSASYIGQYSVRAVEAISTEETSPNVFHLVGTPTAETQEITIIADFANSSLSATTDTLTLDASFEDTEITGHVTYKGADGAIAGDIFADQLIAGFHGATRDIVYAGGIIAYPAP